MVGIKKKNTHAGWTCHDNSTKNTWKIKLAFIEGPRVNVRRRTGLWFVSVKTTKRKGLFGFFLFVVFFNRCVINSRLFDVEYRRRVYDIVDTWSVIISWYNQFRRCSTCQPPSIGKSVLDSPPPFPHPFPSIVLCRSKPSGEWFLVKRPSFYREHAGITDPGTFGYSTHRFHRPIGASTMNSSVAMLNEQSRRFSMKFLMLEWHSPYPSSCSYNSKPLIFGTDPMYLHSGELDICTNYRIGPALYPSYLCMYVCVCVWRV